MPTSPRPWSSRRRPAEILRVISSSPTDVQPVFETIVRSAVQLSRRAPRRPVSVRRRPAASGGAPRSAAEALAALRAGLSDAADPCTGSGRAILTRAVAEIPDVREDAEYQQAWRPRPGGEASSAFRCSGPTARRSGHCHPAGGARAVRRQPCRAPQDLRRPGGDRDRERPPVQGAGGAQQRAAGRAGAADGDQRAPQGDRAVDLRPPAGLRDAGRERGQALRGGTRVSPPLRRSVLAGRGRPQRLLELRAFIERNPIRPDAAAAGRAPSSDARSTLSMSRADPEHTYGLAADVPPGPCWGSPCSGR